MEGTKDCCISSLSLSIPSSSYVKAIRFQESRRRLESSREEMEEGIVTAPLQDFFQYFYEQFSGKKN